MCAIWFLFDKVPQIAKDSPDSELLSAAREVQVTRRVIASDFAVEMQFFHTSFAWASWKISQHGMASQIHHSQSGCAKAHLDRSEEVLAKQTAAHEEAEAAVGRCGYVMSEMLEW